MSIIESRFATFIKNNIPIILLILLSFFAVKPLFSPGFFPIHDDTQVQRVFEMKEALADGVFPVRWVPDLGYNYGYPIFNFYAPLAYYFGGFINLIGIDALVSTKIMMLVGMLLSTISMYLLAKNFWGGIGGFISGLLYMYAPYHAVNLYVRGDVAEIWGYGFLPLAFLGVYKIFTTLLKDNTDVVVAKKSKIKNQKSKLQFKSKKYIWIWISVGAIGYAGVILSHNLTAMMVTPFLIGTIAILAAFSLKNNFLHALCCMLVVVLMGIMLSAFYWVPTLLEMKYTNVLSQVGGGADYHDHFVCFRQLWESPWGFGGSTGGCVLDGLSYRIGKLHLFFAGVSLIALIGLWKHNKGKFLFVLWFIVSLFFAIFLMLDISVPIWDAIAHMAFIQYPWRFLIFASFFSSFLGGGIFAGGKRNLFFLIGICAVAGIIVFNTKLFVPQTIVTRTAKDYTDFKYIAWNTSRISDEYLMKGIYKPKNSNEIPTSKILRDNPMIKILDSKEKTQSIMAKVEVKRKTDLGLRINYFPSWHIFIDGKQSEFRYYKKGFLVPLLPGQHTIEAKFIQTPIEKSANVISLAGVLVLIIGIITTRKERKDAKKIT